MVRVRFAPSPTGNLHIGGVRTALFNWLFAKNNKGRFIVRIEDTDRERSKKEFEDNILSGLSWLGLNWDEGPDKKGDFGPYRQSERADFYKKYAELLLAKNLAYRDGETSGLRFKVPKGETKINDIIRGEISFQNELIEDFVILKSDGTPTYNFAVVIDDYLMKITHVIRGEDHLSNTPKQVLLYNALDFDIPQFAHLPLIIGTDRSPLSKRHGASSVDEYRKNGYLPEAIINFLVLLGWGYNDTQQIFSVDELIEKFSLSRVSKNPAVFDTDKLNWLNGVYIRKLSADELTKLCWQFLEEKKYTGKLEINSKEYEYVKKIVILEQERLKILSEICENTDFFFKEVKEYNVEAAEKFFKRQETKELLKAYIKECGQLKAWNAGLLEEKAKKTVENYNKKLKDIVHPVRLALTGRLVSAGLFQVMEVLGKEICIKRLNNAIDFISLSC